MGQRHLALALLVVTCFVVTARAQGDYDVVIVGAGISGLGAARHLLDSRANIKVVVLEGRSRAGGRMHTIDATVGATTYKIEQGAQWIHGDGKRESGTGAVNPAYALCTSEPTLATTIANTDEVMFDSTGTSGALVSNAYFESTYAVYEEFEEYLRTARGRGGGLTDASNLQQVVDRFLASRKLANKELVGTDLQAFYTWLSSVVEQEYATNSKYLSARWFDEDLGYEGNERILTNGYKSMIDKLIQPGSPSRPVDIKYNANVTKINYAANTGNWVTVTSTQGVFRGKHVIVTLPLGVLKATHTSMFTPALPSAHRTAIQRLGVAVMNKVTLVYPSAWWSEGFSAASKAWLHNLGKNHSRWSEFYNMAVNSGSRPILVGFNIGDYAVQLEGLTDAQATAEAHETFKSMLPTEQASKARPPSASFVTRWVSDPWSRGSYSYIAANAWPEHYEAFETPVRIGARSTGPQVLRFAGEHTNVDDPSTVHGALVSGRREATAVLKLLPVTGRHRRMRA